MNGFRVKLLTSPMPSRVWGWRVLFPPLGIGFIASYLKERGVVVEQDDLDVRTLCDGQFMNLFEKTLTQLSRPVAVADYLVDEDVDQLIDYTADRIDYRGFDLIGFSIGYFNMFNFVITLGMTKKIKERSGIAIVFGGMGVWHNAVSILENFDWVDYIIVGKGEESMFKLCQMLSTGTVAEDEIPGLTYRKNGRVIANESSFLYGTSNLVPDFAGFPLELYEYDYYDILSSLWIDLPQKQEQDILKKDDLKVLIFPYQFIDGCAGKCAFCVQSGGSHLKVTPPYQVASALQRLSREYGAKYFSFLNSQIDISYEYVDTLCDEIIKNKLDIMWSDSASLRNLDERLLDKMRRAGCVKLWYGIELPTDKMLKFIGKKLTVKQAKSALRMAHEAGIWNGVNLIVGMPYETEEDIRQTVEFIQENEQFIDIYGPNKFELKKGSLFTTDPQRYGIRLLPRCSGFEEIDGLSWKERKARTDQAFEILQNLIDPKYNWVSNNAPLLFYLYSLFGNKEEVRRWMSWASERTKQSIPSAW